MRAHVGRVEDFVPGRPRSVTVGGRAVAIVRTEGDTFFALRDACPHHGAPLSAGMLGGTRVASSNQSFSVARHGEILRCPWHGWRFDIVTGCSLHDPSRQRVAVYAVDVEDAEVFITQKPPGTDTAAVRQGPRRGTGVRAAAPDPAVNRTRE